LFSLSFHLQAQKPEQSVMQALESLNDSQVRQTKERKKETTDVSKTLRLLFEKGTTASHSALIMWTNERVVQHFVL
jgi:hypothetical protein